MRTHAIGGFALVFAAALPTATQALTETVHCDGSMQPDTIAEALDAAAMDSEADVITVDGTCTEGLVTISLDDVTIQGGTVLGQLFVDGARRVTLRDMTIQSGAEGPPPEGVSAISSASGSVAVFNVIIEHVGGRGVFLYRGASAVLEGVTIQDTEVAVDVQESSFLLVRPSVIANNAAHGIVASLGSSVRVFASEIRENGELGLLVDQTSAGFVVDSTIRNNGDGVALTGGSQGVFQNDSIRDNSGAGISIDRGAEAVVEASTIENNGTTGISTIRASSLTLVDSTVQGNPEGVSLNTQAVGWLRGSTISTSSTEDDALFIGWGSAARMNGGNTIASPVSAIFLRQGATLNQRSGDEVNGPVTVDALSNAEFRDVSIRGALAVVDHSLVRFRDQSGSSGHVSLRGNGSVSRDSGLDFLRDAGEQRVRVVGNITCADTESSLSAPATNVVVIGKTVGCTGYNNVSN
jgi:hypothetical protein